MPDFDYTVVDGNSTRLKIRGEDLGLDGSGVQIIGQKFLSEELGSTSDPAATDESGTSSAIALLKAQLRELIEISSAAGGGFNEGRTLSPVTVTSTETVIATIDCRGKSSVGLTLHNIGSTALNTCTSKIRTNSNFNFYFPDATSAADYTTGSGNQTGNSTAFIVKANQSPVTLGSNGYAWIKYNVRAIESLQITATVASGSTTMNAWWVSE